MANFVDVLAEARTILMDWCKRRQTITYGELAHRIRSVRLTPRHPWLYELLDDISREEDSQGRGMLSVVVVRKDTRLPGEGFYRLARKLGRDVSDRKRCWEIEFEKVIQAWRN